jgi:hypothetical protein
MMMLQSVGPVGSVQDGQVGVGGFWMDGLLTIWHRVVPVVVRFHHVGILAKDGHEGRQGQRRVLLMMLWIPRSRLCGHDVGAVNAGRLAWSSMQSPARG